MTGDIKNVLITGASGLVGKRLSELLLQKGYQVAHLGRSKSIKSLITSFQWNIDTSIIDKNAFQNCDAIIHLAGAGIADERWTAKRMTEIRNSRINSSMLLYQSLKNIPNQVKVVISASAIGYYGDKGIHWVYENDPPASDFLGETCIKWENAISKIEDLNIRVVKLRTGIVLSNKGGALSRIASPIRYGLGAALGSGEQYVSWIHIDDLCRMYIYALEHKEISGSYNAVAPYPVNNKQLTKSIAKFENHRLWLPNIPGWVLFLILGKIAKSLLDSTRASSQKIIDQHFTFKYKKLNEAMKNLYV